MNPWRKTQLVVTCSKESDGADDNPSVSYADQYEQTLLWVHQTEWQKQLLNRYGNTISLIDATYKTTKYDLALFFICVHTNVGWLFSCG